MLSNLRWQEVLPGALYDELEKLNSGQNLNQRNVFNRLVAILQKYLEIFKQWEDIDNKKNKKKMSVDKTIQYNGFSGTLKHLLAGCGFNKILEALLIRDNSKNINAKNNEGKTPLDFAYASGNLAVMGKIIEMGGIISEGVAAIEEVVSEEEVMEEGVAEEEVMEEGVGAIEEVISTEEEASEEGVAAAIEEVILMEEGVGAIEEVISTEEEASEEGVAAIEEVVSMGEVALEEAATAIEETMEEMEAEEYTSRSIDVLRGQGGNTLLHLVTLSGDIQVIKDLLAAGADVKSKNEDGLTPLQLAATEEIFDVLLEAAAIDSYFTHTNITNVAEQTARAQ